MRYIGQDLIKQVNEEFTLLDSQVKSIRFYTNDVDDLVIEVLFELLLSKKERNVKIIFNDVEEYFFYYSSDHYFYYVESYKFIVANGYFYISLDPSDDLEEVSKNDQDFIICKNIDGYIF